MSHSEVNCLADQNGSLHPIEDLNVGDAVIGVVHHDNMSLFQKALSAFKEAESYIKTSELAAGELDIPSVNELRYYGYHLTRALSYDVDDIDVEVQNTELSKALRHCHRASYDAIELGLINCLEVIADFHQEYGSKIFIQEVITDYLEKMAKVEEIRGVIAQDPKEHRGDYYKQCEGYLQQLNQIKQLLLTSKYLLDAKSLEREELKSRTEAAEERAQKAEERAQQAEERTQQAEKRANSAHTIKKWSLGVSCVALLVAASTLAYRIGGGSESTGAEGNSAATSTPKIQHNSKKPPDEQLTKKDGGA
ncbi:hypothetical protein [Pseudoalteromonas sp. 68 DY56-GL68]|uniref:hypothetical protein n=1 Tax=Pseudoalteromonas sp. 68 DY56-GL68 TaxID=2974919 RepID=UPI00352A7848